MSKGIKFHESAFKKIKQKKSTFLCALCGTQRSMKFKKNLSVKNYCQLFFLGLCVTLFLFPYFGPKIIYMNFILWALVEVINKVLYRNELPCPHCGLDLVWYKRDVKLAHQKVRKFWENQDRNASEN